MHSIFEALASFRIDGFPLWIILLVCVGVFLASFMDAIAGGGGIISTPTYMMAFSGHPLYYAMGTGKFSSYIGTLASTARFIRQGYVTWKLVAPAAVVSLLSGYLGAWLQLRTPETVLKYMLLVVLPVVAFITLKGREWPEEPEPMEFGRQLLIVCLIALVTGVYNGYYGPGTGTFLMISFIHLARMDPRHAAGNVKIINLASDCGSMITALLAGYVFLRVGLIAAAVSMLGHYIGSGLAIKNGSRIVRPTVILVLILLTLKVGSELLFPNLWG